MSEDRLIKNLIINKLTKEQYKTLEEKAVDELYFVTDEEHFTAEEIDELLSTKQNILIAGEGLEILEDGTINNTKVSAEWGNIQGDLSTQTDLQELVETKVDKVEGKSLVDNTEIERLSSVVNYDDTQLNSNIEQLGETVSVITSDINTLKENKQDKLVAGNGIKIEDNVISSTNSGGGTVVGNAEWGSIEGNISAQEDLQNLLNTKGEKLEYKNSTLSLLNSKDEVLNSVTITSGGGSGSVAIDNATLNYNDSNELQVVGNVTVNNIFKNEWIGTLEEYNRDLESGLITADTECRILDDEEEGFDVLLTATVDKKGLVKPDGETIIIDEDGTISAKAGSVEIDIATTETTGIVKPDGTTITITEDGTISAIGGGSSTVIETDNKTITLNSEDKIQVVGSYAVNSQFKNEFVGTRAEYEQALTEGLITEDTVCTITDDTQDVVVPVANIENLGVVKPDGKTISVDDNGTISANIPDVDTSNLANIDLSNITDLGLQNVLSTLANVAKTGSYNDLTDKPTIPDEYTLPTASTDVLGGVKVDGSTISITDGVISAVVSGGGNWEHYKKDADNWYLKNTDTGFIIQCLSWSGNLAGEKTTTSTFYGTSTTYEASTTKTLLTPFKKHYVYFQAFGITKSYAYEDSTIGTIYEGAQATLSNLSTVKIYIKHNNPASANSKAYDIKFMTFGY